MAKEKPDSPTHAAMRQAAWNENTAADAQRPAGNLAVEYRNIDTLIPYVNNARTHSDEQVAQIAASIKEFGWTNPVLVDGDNGIIAGHGRVLAARKLEQTQIPVIELQGLSDAQRRAYVLADNRLAQNAGWDEDLLHLELTELGNADFDLSLLGFEPGELKDLLAGEPEEGLTDPDEVPEPPAEAITQPGDLWLLGAYYECDDCGKEYDYDIGKEMAECPCG
jgi:ParB-like chromosome segregation protein Spo0J